jgi:hypothetical protein
MAFAGVGPLSLSSHDLFQHALACSCEPNALWWSSYACVGRNLHGLAL